MRPTESGFTCSTAFQKASVVCAEMSVSPPRPTAAEIITQPFEYDIDYLGLILTVVVILGYYFFVISMSRKEYREVIREKFE